MLDRHFCSREKNSTLYQTGYKRSRKALTSTEKMSVFLDTCSKFGGFETATGVGGVSFEIKTSIMIR